MFALQPSRYTRELRAKPAHVRATRDADPHKLSGKKKMGETPIILLPVVAPEPHMKPHAQ
jgi:hypothetical protein